MSDTSYIVDIAASMPEAGVTTAQLDELSQALIAAGASSETLEAATISCNEQLIAAKAAVAAANAALAEGNAKYGELERAAVGAAKAVEKARLKGPVDESLLEASYAATEALSDYEDELHGLESAAASAVASQDALANAQSNLRAISASTAKAVKAAADAEAKAVSSAAAEQAKSLSEQAAATKKSVREAEGFAPAVKQFNDLSDAMSTSEGQAVLLGGAVSATAVAVVALTAALVVGTLAVASWAVGLADARRDLKLTDEAVAVLEPSLAGLSAGFAAITDETGVGSAELRGFAKQLQAAKVPAADLPAHLRAIALSSAAMGQEGVSAYMDRLRDAKGATADLAAEVSHDLGGVVAKKLLGLDQQAAKFKKNVSDLFGGLNIEPVLNGLQTLVGLFDKSTAAGAAMQLLFESVFQPLIDQAENAAYVVEAFVLGFLIGMTKLYIALKPAIKAVSDFFGFDDTSLTDVCKIATVVGEAAVVVFLGFVGVLAAVALAVAAAVAPLVAMTAAGAAVIGAMMALGAYLLGGFVNAWHAVTDFLGSIDLAAMGSQIIQGLANGIMSAGGAVVNAITGVAHGAIDSAKKVLGIASPSKVFAEIGGFTGEGFVAGVDDMAGAAQASMASLVEPPAPGSAYAAAVDSGSSGAAEARSSAKGDKRGASVHIENLTIKANDATGGKAAADAFYERMGDLLEGDAAAVDGAEDEEAA